MKTYIINVLWKGIIMKLLSLFEKKTAEPHCAAVIVAAGNSLRMGTNKTEMDLGGMPVLTVTLRAFEKCERVDEIVVVTRQDKIMLVADMCKQYGISKVSKVVIGGATRMESSLAGVASVSEKAKLIAIHDGARPFVTSELIVRLVDAAAKYNAAAPVLRSTDTLKAVDENGNIVGTVDRDVTVRVQTPQVFDADLIKAALTKAMSGGMTITDDCAAVEMLGTRIFAVEGDEDNIKLTTPKDMPFAKAILSVRGE